MQKLAFVPSCGKFRFDIVCSNLMDTLPKVTKKGAESSTPNQYSPVKRNCPSLGLEEKAGTIFPPVNLMIILKFTKL